MSRPPIMPEELNVEACRIMRKYGITYEAGTFRMTKPLNPRFPWDRFYTFRFFTSPQRLHGSCAVIEMHMCYAPEFSTAARPVAETFPGVTGEEWTTLFKWDVREILRYQGRRMALATLIASQRKVVPFLREAGFESVSTGYNPSTRHKVTVWALSI